MSNSVYKKNASVISLFVYFLKHYINNLGSLGYDKYRGKRISDNSYQTRGNIDEAHDSG